MYQFSGNMSKGQKPKGRMTKRPNAKRPNEKKFNIVGQKAECPKKPNSPKGRIIHMLVI